MAANLRSLLNALAQDPDQVDQEVVVGRAVAAALGPDHEVGQVDRGANRAAVQGAVQKAVPRNGQRVDRKVDRKVAQEVHREVDRKAAQEVDPEIGPEVVQKVALVQRVAVDLRQNPAALHVPDLGRRMHLVRHPAAAVGVVPNRIEAILKRNIHLHIDIMQYLWFTGYSHAISFY